MTDQGTPQADSLGTVIRNMREEDRVTIWLDGRRVGEIFIARVPHDLKVRIGFSFDRRYKIAHAEAER